MSGSAAVVVLGSCVVFGFLYVMVGRVSSISCLVGAFLASLWFPLVFALIEAGFQRKISGWSLFLYFFSYLTTSEALIPTVSFFGAAFFGILIGEIARRISIRARAD